MRMVSGGIGAEKERVKVAEEDQGDVRPG